MTHPFLTRSPYRVQRRRETVTGAPPAEAGFHSADELRPGDLVGLFPNQRALVLTTAVDPDRGDWRFVTVVDADREWSRHHVPAGELYAVHRRGAGGRAADRVALAVSR